jgi:hypothetical protein
MKDKLALLASYIQVALEASESDATHIIDLNYMLNLLSEMDAWEHSDNLDSWEDWEGYNNPWRDSKMGSIPHPLTRIYSPWRDLDETE